MKHFLKETDFSIFETTEIFSLAENFKKLRNRHTPPALQRQSWALLFFKSSTRTRISFEVGVRELGGNVLYLDEKSMQLSRGESVSDTARILSGYLHGLIIRAYEHEIVEEFAREGSIPVINALTDFLHPCQTYSDAFTMAERWSTDTAQLESLRGRKIAFLGDCAGNMANSWILGAHHFGMELALAGPSGFSPCEAIESLLHKTDATADIQFSSNAREAVKDADVVYTDVWVSMGNEAEEAERLKQMSPYAVTRALMNEAKPDALFMHCLPAHPGLEVAGEVLNSPQSVVFDQAENRLHVQKGILAVVAQSRR